MPMSLRLLIFVAFYITISSSLICSRRIVTIVGQRSYSGEQGRCAVLLAKKKSSSANKTKQSNAKGFTKTKPVEITPSGELAAAIETDSPPMPPAKTPTTSVSSSSTKKEPRPISDSAIEGVFAKYGFKDDVKGSKTKAKAPAKSLDDPDRAFGEEVLAKIPLKVQSKIDQFLITATFGALSFVILCGIGITLDAFKVVFPSVSIPSELENVMTNVLSPSFTPALLFFFLCSITFGLFKFAQISSNQTVYKEEEY